MSSGVRFVSIRGRVGLARLDTARLTLWRVASTALGVMRVRMDRSVQAALRQKEGVLAPVLGEESRVSI